MAIKREDQEREREGRSAPDLADSISAQTASATMVQMPPPAAMAAGISHGCQIASVIGGKGRVRNRSTVYPFHRIL